MTIDEIVEKHQVECVVKDHSCLKAALEYATKDLSAEISRLRAWEREVCATLLDRDNKLKQSDLQNERLQKKLDQLNRFTECFVAHPYEGTLECDLSKPCPFCRFTSMNRLNEQRQKHNETLMALLMERRAMEPKHSREDHECNECIQLAAMTGIDPRKPLKRNDLQQKCGKPGPGGWIGPCPNERPCPVHESRVIPMPIYNQNGRCAPCFEGDHKKCTMQEGCHCACVS